MSKITAFFLVLIGVFGAYAALACDLDMDHWQGDTPGMWHGHDYYGCPYMNRKVPKKFRNMTGADLFQANGCTGCHTIVVATK